jgi:hypothetical protein
MAVGDVDLVLEAHGDGITAVNLDMSSGATNSVALGG